MKTYLLVDGKNLLWRAESTMGMLSANGKATGGIHGFIGMLLRVVDTYRPTKLVVCWDNWKADTRNVRKSISPTYKQRDLTPNPERERSQARVAEQQQDLMGFFKKLGVKQARSPGWEADDVMGTLAQRYKARGKVLILTGDRDLLQCIDTNVVVVRPMQDGTLKDETRASVEESYGIKLEQFIAFKALVGDASDGYKGCPGIGEKSASKILEKFYTPNDAIHGAKDGKSWAPLSPGWAKKLVEHEDAIRTCYKLATINTAAPLKFMAMAPDYHAALQLLHRWQMNVHLTHASKLRALAWRRR